MASATPFCCYTTQKHLVAESGRCSDQGQQAFRDRTYYRRMQEFADIVQKYLQQGTGR